MNSKRTDEDEGRDERIVRAAMQSLSTQAPAGLKAELRRMVRPPQPSVWDGLRQALSGGAWAYGAGAAFAAAVVALALWRAVPAAGPEMRASSLAARSSEGVADAVIASASDLAAMWADDDGEDHDES